MLGMGKSWALVSVLMCATAWSSDDTSSRLDDLQAQIDALSQNQVSAQQLGLPLHGFADVGYFSNSGDNVSQDGFVIGNLDFYMTPKLGGRWLSLAELVFEVNEEGELATDLERLQFGYAFNDALTLWVGRFHTPYGYWNTAFHHGAQIQPSIARPRFVDFEDDSGILPAHGIGLLASGHINTGAGKIYYDGYLTNGNRIADGVLDFNAAGDNDHNKQIGINARYAFGGVLDGFSFGVHALRQTVATIGEAGDVTARTNLQMSGAYTVLDTDSWQGVAEYYRFHNADVTSGAAYNSTAWFAQLGYVFVRQTQLYVRVEKADLDTMDAYFADQESGRSYRRSVVGGKYDINRRIALKAEFLTTKEADDTSWHGIATQCAVSF